MAIPFSVAQAALDVKNTVLVDYDDSELEKRQVLYLDVTPTAEWGHVCPMCGRQCPKEGHASRKPRKWRANDWGAVRVYLRYRTQRIRCPEHDVITEAVPWAQHKARFTYNFEKLVLQLAMSLSMVAIAAVLGIDWHSIYGCIKRYLDNIADSMGKSRFDGLIDIVIDETSYKKGHKYITVVLNARTKMVVWAAEGHGYSVIKKFFKELTKEQLASIRTVSGDGARWIDKVVTEFCPHASRCVDPFHVVVWASMVLDKVRLRVSRMLKQAGDKAAARLVKGSQIALGKDRAKLSAKQQERLDYITLNCPDLYAAYLLKEELRRILTLKGQPEVGQKALENWYNLVEQSGIKEFQELASKIRRHQSNICNSLQYGGNSARIEATNNNIKLIIRRAYGFRNVLRLVDHVRFCCSGQSIALPSCPHRSVEAEAV